MSERLEIISRIYHGIKSKIIVKHIPGSMFDSLSRFCGT